MLQTSRSEFLYLILIYRVLDLGALADPKSPVLGIRQPQLKPCVSRDSATRRIAIDVRAAYPVAMKTLEEMIRDLPPDAQRKVEDFVKELAKSTMPTPKRKLDQRWAGALKRYRDQYTSLQLQRKALEWRGD